MESQQQAKQRAREAREGARPRRDGGPSSSGREAREGGFTHQRGVERLQAVLASRAGVGNKQGKGHTTTTGSTGRKEDRSAVISVIIEGD